MSDEEAYFRIQRLVHRVFSGVNIEVQGEEYVPSEGPGIVALNHPAGPIHIEAIALGITFPRKLTGMILEEAYRRPETGLPLKYLEWRGIRFIPVNRDHGSDHQAARRAIEALEKGKMLVIAPEAGLENQEVKLGAAWLATRTGAPVVPVAIWRTGEDGSSLAEDVCALFRRRKLNLHINVGEPFSLMTPRTMSGRERRESLARGAKEIMRRINLLLPEGKRPSGSSS